MTEFRLPRLLGDGPDGPVAVYDEPARSSRQFRYNPFQKRAPKGSPIGGRWTSDDNAPHTGQILPDRNPTRTTEEERWQARAHQRRAATVIVPSRQDRETRAGELFGQGANAADDAALDILFPNGALTAVIPFRSASRLKGERLFDQDLVNRTLAETRALRPVDPRVLHATQPGLKRDAVRYYLGQEHNRTGTTYADQYDVGNALPVIYKRPNGQHIILSGHHRAAAALLRGGMLDAIYIDPAVGPPPRRIEDRRTEMATTESLSDTVAPITTLGSTMYRDVTPLLAIDEEFTHPAEPAAAVTAIKRGNLAIVANPDDAIDVLVTLGSSKRHARWLVAGAAPDPPRAVTFADRSTRQFHLQGQHDQKSHGNRGGSADSGHQMPEFSDEMMAFADTLGASIPVPSREELLRYDPVPGTTENEQILLKYLESDGTLSPQRRVVHNTLILEGVTRKDGTLHASQPEGKKRAVVVGGGPAAGKSVSLDLGFVEKPPDAAEINPDEFKILLPESRGPTEHGKEGDGLADKYPEEWASIQHEESSHIGKRAIEGALESNMNIVIDKVQSKPSGAVAQIRDLQARGYEVDVAFVTTDVDRAVVEAKRRGEEKGRHVGEAVVRHGHDGANHSFLVVAADTNVEAQLLTTYPKNADGSYSDPVRTATATGSGGLRVHSRTAWSEYMSRLTPAAAAVLDDLEITFD